MFVPPLYSFSSRVLVTLDFHCRARIGDLNSACRIDRSASQLGDIDSINVAYPTYSILCIEPAQEPFDSRREMLKRVLIADDNLYVRYLIRTF
jgi:hypothetical protein